MYIFHRDFVKVLLGAMERIVNVSNSIELIIEKPRNQICKGISLQNSMWYKKSVQFFDMILILYFQNLPRYIIQIMDGATILLFSTQVLKIDKMTQSFFIKKLSGSKITQWKYFCYSF